MSQVVKHNKTMYEQKTEEIISTKEQKSTIKISRFLKPISLYINLASNIPKTPFIYEIFSHKKVKKWPFKVHFTGWKKPKKNWEKWYYNLVIKHGTTWLNAGILDGIHSSMHKIPCNKTLVLAVCEFWCPETNTFVFPWGEATISLEDVMVLAGFPVLGGSIYKALEAEMTVVVETLLERKRMISNDVVRHRAWLKHFMPAVEVEEGEIVTESESEVEHVAFLVLWLSRFVFPDMHEGLIKKHVFPIAVHLSRGKPLCIAPIVLANLYRDLTMLVEKLNDPCFNARKVNVSGLFKIVQLWVCERFPVFAERFAKPVHVGDPRVARWDNVDVKLKLPRVRSRLMSGEGFRWRPYADGLANWEVLPFYGEGEQIIDGSDECPCEELPSFSRFCHPCTLVGLKCKEKYNPHRVGMQFGFDQDLPGEVSVSNSVFEKVGFPIPSRNFVGGMTRRYYDWWKDMMVCHKEAVSNALRLKASEEIVVEDGKNVGASVCPQLMQVQEIANAPVMVNLQESDEKQLVKEPSSPEEGEIREVPEISKNVVSLHSPQNGGDNDGVVSSDLGGVVLALGISAGVATEKHPGDEITLNKSPSLLENKSAGIHTAVSPDSPQNKNDNMDVCSDLESVALALKNSAKVATEKHPGDEITQNKSPSLSENKSVEIHTVVSPDSPQNKGDIIDVCSDVDSVPLALRISAMVATMHTKKHSGDEITRNRSRSLENKTVTSVAIERDLSNSCDKDHVPLTSRLETIIDVKRTPKPIESHASTVNVRNPNKRAELASPTSDDAASKITGKRSSSLETIADTTKEKLEVRLSKLEINVAKLGVFQFGLEFLDE